MASPISRRFWAPTELLSETARKERRSLLATASVAILVAWMKLDQTEIELAGFKFHDVHLPALIGLSLLATVTYLLAKFCFSYWIGQFNSQMESYAAQIRHGETEIDIGQIEKELLEASRSLIEQQIVFQDQQESEKKKLAELQEIIRGNDDLHAAALKTFDTQLSELEAALKGPRGKDYFPIPSMNATIDPDPEKIKGVIENVEKEKARLITNRLSARDKELSNLKYEESRSQTNEKGRRSKIATDEEAINVKKRAVTNWRLASKGAIRISPWHLFLEAGLPVAIGALAIILLLWFLTHLPPPPAPLSLPEF